jgi:hypothetical protein
MIITLVHSRILKLQYFSFHTIMNNYKIKLGGWLLTTKADSPASPSFIYEPND